MAAKFSKMFKASMPDHGSSLDESEELEIDSEDIKDEPSSIEGHKLKEDMCYSVLLEEKRLHDSNARQPSSKKTKQHKRKRKPETIKYPPKKRKRRDSSNESSIDSSDPMDFSEDDESVKRRMPKALSGDVKSNLETAAMIHQRKIDMMVENAREKKEKEKSFIDRMAFAGLVGLGATLDQTLGYDGSFGDHLKNNQELQGLLSQTLEYECGDTRRVVEEYGKWGLVSLIGLEYMNYRGISLSSITKSAAPSVQASPAALQAPKQVSSVEPAMNPVQRQQDQQVLEPAMQKKVN